MSLNTGLMSAYTFENGASMGTDASGHGNTLTKTGTVPQGVGNASPGTNAATWSDGGGFSPQGILSAHVNVIPPATSWTVVVWVKALTGSWNTTPYDMFVCGIQGGGNDQYGLSLQQSTLKPYFFVSGGGAGGTIAPAGSAIVLGTWNMWLGQWNTATKKTGFSLNGGAVAEVASGISGDPFQSSPTVFSVGSNGNGAGFTMDGSTDGLSIWSRLLSAGEITQLYNGGAGLEPPFPSGRRTNTPAFIL